MLLQSEARCWALWAAHFLTNKLPLRSASKPLFYLFTTHSGGVKWNNTNTAMWRSWCTCRSHGLKTERSWLFGVCHCVCFFFEGVSVSSQPLVVKRDIFIFLEWGITLWICPRCAEPQIEENTQEWRSVCFCLQWIWFIWKWFCLKLLPPLVLKS